MAEKTDKNVTAMPGAEKPEDENEQKKLVGYILSPQAMQVLLDEIENIPGRHYKRMQPLLQSAQPVIENPDGSFMVGG